MRIGYFDCFCGAAGDMILGALVGAGLSPDDLRTDLRKLPIKDFELDVREVNKQGFAAVRVDVRATGKSEHRHLHHITRIIGESGLSPAVKTTASRIFVRLAEAEAKVHGTSIEKVHFHEVGAVDAIVDVVGAAAGIERLGIGRIFCSQIPTGSGTVRCAHGVMPVPAPATAELLKGVPIAACEETGELITPTGAAILTTLSESYGPLPPIRIEKIGCGAGSRDGQTRPNLLRLFIGESSEGELAVDEVIVLETNLDDATGEQIGHAIELLFAAGALDVFSIPIAMKKNRPGILLSVLAAPDRASNCEDVLLKHTSTFGIRRHTSTRHKLERRIETVGTRFGPIRVKIGVRSGEVVRVAPEYEDCAAAATAHHVALGDVMFEARACWHSRGEIK